MRRAGKVRGTAAALVVLGVALTGCESSAPSTANSQPPEANSTMSGPAASSGGKAGSSKTGSNETGSNKTGSNKTGSNKTMADYLKEAGIAEVRVHRGDPGAPTIELPAPAGWQHAGDKTPDWAYDALVFDDPAAAADPPTVIALLTKLTGPVDKAKLLELAPGELENLPGFDAMGGTGRPTTLAGFDAFQFGGSYVKDGVARLIAQKTVVIPAKDGDAVYVLQLNANGVEEWARPLVEATSELDGKARITP